MFGPNRSLTSRLNLLNKRQMQSFSFISFFSIVFLITLLIIAICLVLLCVRLFFGKSFVKTHVDQSKAMRQRGIHCVQSQDAEMRYNASTKIQERTTRTTDK